LFRRSGGGNVTRNTVTDAQDHSAGNAQSAATRQRNPKERKSNQIPIASRFSRILQTTGCGMTPALRLRPSLLGQRVSPRTRR